jgi:hypothetical protein|tara:strand:- start:725 stop:1225 length:501 start_codon:yes stop_codon:yes gene_type:complete
MFLFIEIMSVALAFIFAANVGAESATRELLTTSNSTWDLSGVMSMAVNKKGRIIPKYQLALPLAHAIFLIGVSPWIVGFFVTALVGALMGGVGLALDYFHIGRPMLDVFSNDIEYITVWKYGAMVIPGFYVGRSSVLGYAAKLAQARMHWSYKEIFLEAVEKQKDI